MAIHLIDGNPGSSKTLQVIAKVVKLREDIFKQSGYKPDVYYSGLMLFRTLGDYLDSLDVDSPEHEKCRGMDREAVHPKWSGVSDWKSISSKRLKEIYVPLEQIEADEPDLVYHSDDIKTGSIFIVDEAHFVYGGDSRKLPPHIEFFTIHRHSGFNFYLLTQDPMLIHKKARDRVQHHQHFERISKAEMVKVTTSRQKLISETAPELLQTSTIPFPKEYYRLYKSADFHTQTESKWAIIKNLPLSIKLTLIIAIILTAWNVPKLMSGGMGLELMDKPQQVENGLSSSSPSTSSNGGFSIQKKDKDSPVFYLSHFMSEKGNTLAVFDYVFPDTAFLTLNEKDLDLMGVSFKKIKEGVYFIDGQLVTKRPSQTGGKKNDKKDTD